MQRPQMMEAAELSIDSVQLDGIDAFLILLGGAALFAILAALGAGGTGVKSGAIIAGMIAGPAIRHVTIGPALVFRSDHSRLILFLGLIMVAIGLVLGGIGGLVLYLRVAGGKHWTTAAITCAIGFALLALGALVDRTQRATR